ncbi:glycosyltransferase [Oscillatoria amoena NRMC-F 0135]|nr:glycosyltransferase [Oscillatoria amoena NRMC-F 0135]
MSLLAIAFLASLIVQLVFFALLLWGITRRNLHPITDDQPAVTVLVCAHDEEENLRQLVPQVLQQDYPYVQLVVVDDRSNDGTYDYIRKLSVTDKRVKAVRVEHLPDHVNAKKYGITLGVKAATTEWILLTDADCMPQSSGWITTMSRYMDNGAQFVLGFSPYEKQLGLLNVFIRFETLFTAIQYMGFAHLGMPYMGVGRNLAYRKSWFLANKGFNTLMNVTGGDDDLYVNRHVTRSTVRVCLGKESLVNSKPKQSLAAFFKQKKRHLFAGKKYRLKHRVVLALFMGSYGLTWLTGLLLLSTGFEWMYVAGLLALRSISFAWLVHRAAVRLGVSFAAYAVPFLDILFVFYYLSTAPVALISKRVKWMN